MPRRTGDPVGIIVRDAHIQIDLRAHGFGRERLELQPTPANIRYAERLRQEILGKIERGTFALASWPSGVRYRDARQTRHTFATICLHAGITPGWVAQQLGHSVEMFYRVYSRWIEGADKGAERRKLDAFLGPTGTGT